MTRRGLVLCGLLAVLGPSGCADLLHLEEGECGNRVIDREDGEDCDGLVDPALGEDTLCGPADGSAQQCRYVCDGAECPVGWACEDDGICRAPSGELDVPDGPTLAVAADEILLADLEGEAQAELVTRLDGELSIFVDADDGPSRAGALYIPNVRGLMVAADVDEDEHDDLVLPSVSAASDPNAQARVHALRFDGERLQPAVAPQTAIDDLAGGWPDAQVATAAMRLRPTAGSAAEVVGLVAWAEGGLHALVPEPSCSTLPRDAVLTVWPQAAEDQAPIPATRDATASAPATTALPLAGEARVPLLAWTRSCAATVCSPRSPQQIPCVTQPVELDPVLLPAAVVEPGCAFWDVDGDALDDLVCHAEGDQLYAALAGAEGFEAPAPIGDALAGRTDLPEGQQRACEPGHPLLATADLDADGRVDLVTPHGVFLASDEGWTRAYARDRGDAWGEAVLGDFDGDGALEVVATVLDATQGCSARSLEHLVPTLGRFGPRVVPASTLPLHIDAGDFDGDGLDDLVVVEQVEADDVGVAVLFGDAEGALEDRAATGTYSRIDALVPARTRSDTALHEDLLEDVVVLSDGGEQWTLYTGTPSRTLLSPLPLLEAGGAPVGSTTVSVLVGPLLSRPDPTKDDDEDDEETAGPPDLGVLARGHAWLLRDEDLHHGDAVVHWTDDTLPPALSELRAACTRWAMVGPPQGPAMLGAIDGAVLPGGLDEGCDLDGQPPRLIVAAFGRAADPVPEAVALPVPDDARRPRSIAVFDFGIPDDAPDVVVQLRRSQGARGAVLLWSNVSLAGAPEAAEDLLPDHEVLAVAPFNGDRDQYLELAVLTTEGLRILDRPDDGSAPVLGELLAPLPEPLLPTAPLQLVAGEVDGDGIVDLALLLGRSIYLYPMLGED